MAQRQYCLLLTCLLLLLSMAATATSRGISIDLRESASIDAPVSETVELYTQSFALVIGIDDYNNGWPRLSNAVKDAEVVASELKQQGFEVELYKNLDSEQLATTFKRFFTIRGQDPSARLFVWFAGHGMTLDGEGYLVPADAPVPSDSMTIGEFKFSAYFLRDFGGLMRAAKSKHAYAVFDACFAGTVFASARALPPPAITRATTKPVRQFLTSGDANQEVSDDGTFRELFVRAIRGEERADANGDGYVTASELGMYLNDRVTNLTEEAQTPRYGKLRDKNFDLGDFVFVLPGGERTGGTPIVSRTAPDPEIIFWNSIQGGNSAAEFDAYLSQYPDGKFAELARARKQEIERKELEAKRVEEARRNFEVAYVDQDMMAGSTANVRVAPFPDAQRVGQLAQGATVWVIGETRTPGGLWYKIARDGVELGFVYSPLLNSIATDAEYVQVVPLPMAEPEITQETMVAEAGQSAGPDTAPAPENQLSGLVEDLLQEIEFEEVATPNAPDAVSADQPRTMVVDGALRIVSGNAAEQVQDSVDRPVQPETVSDTALVPSGEMLAELEDVESAEAVIADSGIDVDDVEPVDTELALDDEVVDEVATAQTDASPDHEMTKHEVAEHEMAEVGADTVATTEQAPDPVVVVGTDLAEPVLQAMETLTVSEAAEPVATAPVEEDQIVALLTDEPLPSLAEVGAPANEANEVVADEVPEVTLSEPETRTEPDAAQVVTHETLVEEAPETIVEDAADNQQEAGVGGFEYLDQYVRAAESGNVKAATSLGYLYETGESGFPIDQSRSVRWYKVAAEKGETVAMVSLALLYESGEGLGGPDLIEAAFWYRRAADAGDAPAQMALAYMYENGTGVMKDVVEAARWYEKAALGGSGVAQNNLARLYQLGIGVEKDLDRASYWYRKAAEQGNAAARQNLDALATQ